MKNKLTKVISAVLAFLMIFGTVITNLGITKTYAADNIIKNISVDRSTIQHGEHFSLDVEFGGPGTKVADGQTERIDFSSSSNIKIKLPEKSIQLHDRNTGHNLGEVTFESNTATIKFNKTAAGLNDIQGGFYFSITGHYLGNIQQEGSGSISITSGSIRKDVELINHQGGTSTSNVYRKEGVWDSGDPEGNRVDWRFIFNAAHKPTYGKDIQFVVKDKLADTMEWDMDTIEGSKYVLQYRGQWMSLEDARKKNFGIRFNGQDVEITIPAYVLGDGVNWTAPLDQDEVSVSLTARVKEAVMKNPTIKYVENTSVPELSGKQIDDWKLNEKENSAKVEIIRQGGWIQGTVPGELKIKKVIRGKTVPIKGVEFTLERKDKAEFEAKDGEEIKRGTSIKLVTNADGIIDVKELRAGDYIVKETNAPEWLDNNSRGIVREFTVSDKDIEGTEFTIENEKKITQIKINKKWLDSAGKDLTDYPNIKVELYRNDKPINKVTLGKGKLEHIWDNLEITDDTGKIYEYHVKEVNEENKSIKIDEKWYSVIYEGDINKGFSITNKQVPTLTPLVPATRDIKVTKNWKDIKGDKATAPVEKIKVQLFKDGSKEGEVKELTKENGWETTFEKLPVSEKVGSKNHEYTVKEVDDSGANIEDGGSIRFNGKWYEVRVKGSMKDGFTITNKEKTPWTPMIPTTRDIKVTKDWKAANGDKLNSSIEKVEVELYKDGTATGKKLELNKQNNWSGTFEKLAVSEKLNSKNYEYTVKEVGESKNTIKLDGKWFKVEVKGSMKDGFTITNKEKRPWTPMIPLTRNIKVTKNWELLTTEKPVEKIEVELYKDGVATGKKLELNAGNKWSGEFKKLEVADKLGSTDYYQYTVKEVGETGNSIKLEEKWFKVSYEGSMKDGFKIVNQEKIPWAPMIPPIRDIKVTKDWKGSDGNKIEAPVDKIEVELYKDGVATGKKLKLAKDNNWSGEFKKLEVADKLGSTDYYQYTVKEVGERGSVINLDGKWYGVSYEGTMKDGFTITNKEKTLWTPMIPPTRTIKVTKEWKNDSGSNLEAPVDKIEVELYKDGVATGKKLKLAKYNNWSGEFKKLEVADGLGSTNYYQYTVKEIGETTGSIKLDGKWYGVSYEGTMKDGFTITNKEKRPWIPMVPPVKPEPPVKPKNPDTSDNFTNMTFISIIVVSVLGLGYISLNKNKRISR